MSLIDDIRRDRKAGTPGPWQLGKDADEDHGFGWFVKGDGYCRAHIVGPIIHTEANARRIARVPDLEATLLLADKMADILEAAIHEHDTADHEWKGNENPWTMKEWFEDEDRAALAAYREATK